MVQLNDLLINRPEPIERLIAEDCQKVGVAIAFFLRQEQIVSETVDNQNASIHLRAVLAGLFLYVEALEPSTDDASRPMAHDATQVSSVA